jgi:hypothetical protein
MFSRGQSCRGRSQSPVDRIAEGIETEPPKPIDNVSLGEINESPGRNNSERSVASKGEEPRAEPASVGRRQYGVPKSDRYSIPTSAG